MATEKTQPHCLLYDSLSLDNFSESTASGTSVKVD